MFDCLVHILAPNPIFHSPQKKQHHVKFQLAAFLIWYGQQGSDTLDVAAKLSIGHGTVHNYCRRVSQAWTLVPSVGESRWQGCCFNCNWSTVRVSQVPWQWRWLSNMYWGGTNGGWWAILMLEEIYKCEHSLQSIPVLKDGICMGSKMYQSITMYQCANPLSNLSTRPFRSTSYIVEIQCFVPLCNLTCTSRSEATCNPTWTYSWDLYHIQGRVPDGDQPRGQTEMEGW